MTENHVFLVVDKPTPEQEKELYPLVIHPVSELFSVIECEEYNLKRVTVPIKEQKNAYGDAYHAALRLTNPVEGAPDA